MKTAKYRAWDRAGRVMHNPWYDIGPGVEDNYDLLQFTGKLDIGKHEIFDGDIVKFTSTGGGKFVGAVAFEQGKWIIERSNGHKTDLYLWSKKREIIGNVFENPELMK